MRILKLIAVSTLTILAAVALGAQEPPQGGEPNDGSKDVLRKALPKREESEENRLKREKRLREELNRHYKQWLEEDASYIITAEEKAVFKDLNTSEEREQFIEHFWFRRDPTPDTVANEYKEEHYLRIAYANEKYSIGKPGWKSDRGRIYILWGRPDELDARPAGSQYHTREKEGTNTSIVYAFEKWRYTRLPGIGNEVKIEFVDRNGDGDMKLLMEKEELEVFLTPGTSRALMEQMGFATPYDRNIEYRQEGELAYADDPVEFLQRLQLYSKINAAPPVAFKDLEEIVNTRISYNLLPFELRTDYVRVTDSSALVPLTLMLQKSDLAFETKDGVRKASVNVFGRISTLSGRAVQTFEDVIQLSALPESHQELLRVPAIYQKTVPLAPGLYKLTLVLKDLSNGNVGTREMRLTVPRFEPEELAYSSLILADQIQRIDSRSIGSGPFVIGEMMVRPKVDSVFRQGQTLGVYMQVYHLALDGPGGMPFATLNYRIQRDGKPVFEFSETTDDMVHTGPQITIQKVLGLDDLEPGSYKFVIDITDNLRKVSATSSARFRVVP